MCMCSECHSTSLPVQRSRILILFKCVFERRVDVNKPVSQGTSGWRMPDASKPQRRCLSCALWIFFKFKFKTNKSALYRIKIIDVDLVLGTYLQIARHHLCGFDAFGMGHTKRRATIGGRPHGFGRPHLQKCHRSMRSMFTSFVVCAFGCEYWRLLLLYCTNNFKCNTEWCYLYL